MRDDMRQWIIVLLAAAAFIAYILAWPMLGSAQEVEKLKRADWVIAPKMWVWPDGNALVVIGFNVEPEDATAQWADAARWGITPSQRSLGKPWPVAHTVALPGTSGWGAGFVVLYGPAYEPLDLGDPNFLARVDYINQDTGWEASAWPDATRFGTGMGETVSFAPRLVLEDSVGMREWILRLTYEVGLYHDTVTVSGDTVYGAGQVYLSQQLPGIESLIPLLFGSEDAAPIAPTEAEVAEIDIITKTRDDFDFIGMFLEGFTGLFGFTPKQATSSIITIISAVAAVLMVIWTRIPLTAIPAAWLVALFGWRIGWMDGAWVGVVMFVAAVAAVWATIAKRSS